MKHRIRGPFGNELVIEVPGPGVSEATFRHMVDKGEWTIVADEKPAAPEPKKPAPRKRTPRKTTAK